MNEKDEKSAAIAMFERCYQAKPITSPDVALDTIERVYLTPLAAVVRAEVERLRQDLAAARADAERYRWLRKVDAFAVLTIAWRDPAAVAIGADCDKAIDAVRAGERREGEG